MGLTPSLLSWNSSNSRYPVHFTSSTSPSHVTFLDVNVRIHHGQFCTYVHVKPTNFQKYLHYHSCHTTSTICSFPYSLATRRCRTCNHPDDLHTYTSNLTRAFTYRVYPVPFIQKQLFHGLPQDTHHLSLITTYYPGIHRVKRILREGFHILSSDPST